jgi:hypothetical protein
VYFFINNSRFSSLFFLKDTEDCTDFHQKSLQRLPAHMYCRSLQDVHAIDSHILEQAEAEGKIYVEDFLRGRDDIKVLLAMNRRIRKLKNFKKTFASFRPHASIQLSHLNKHASCVGIEMESPSEGPRWGNGMTCAIAGLATEGHAYANFGR